MDFTIGTDPEMFVKDKSTGKIASIVGILGGTKESPFDIGNGCSVQEDNILAEFNIPPVTTEQDFIDHIDYCKDYISTIAASKGLEPHYSSSELVDMETIGDANEFGCSPSMNVVLEEIVQVKLEDIPVELHNLRTSGFHIHFGNPDMTDDQKMRLVLCFELCCSLPLSPYDLDKYDRRQFYGMFGDCRFKDYGVECRSLGGYFLRDNESISQVWKGIQKTIDLFNNKEIETPVLREMVDYCLGENGTVIEENIKEVTNDLQQKKKKTV